MNSVIVGAKDFRTNFVKYQALVASGRRITVVKRSRPIFEVVPVAEEDRPTKAELDRMLDEAIAEPNASPILSSDKEISDYLATL